MHAYIQGTPSIRMWMIKMRISKSAQKKCNHDKSMQLQLFSHIIYHFMGLRRVLLCSSFNNHIVYCVQCTFITCVNNDRVLRCLIVIIFFIYLFEVHLWFFFLFCFFNTPFLSIFNSISFLLAFHSFFFLFVVIWLISKSWQWLNIYLIDYRILLESNGVTINGSFNH